MSGLKLWVDDVRPAPKDYVWCKSVKETIETIKGNEWNNTLAYDGTNFELIDLIDIDHDAGEFAEYGGDYINLLNWLEETGRNYPIRIHSMNPVGVANMRRIIQRNGWKEVF